MMRMTLMKMMTTTNVVKCVSSYAFQEHVYYFFFLTWLISRLRKHNGEAIGYNQSNFFFLLWMFEYSILFTGSLICSNTFFICPPGSVTLLNDV